MPSLFYTHLTLRYFLLMSSCSRLFSPVRGYVLYKDLQARAIPFRIASSLQQRLASPSFSYVRNIGKSARSSTIPDDYSIEDNEERKPNRSRSWIDRNNSVWDDFRGTRVFVQNIPLHITWDQLKDHFKIAGNVVYSSISVDSETGLSKGCGIVQFENAEMANRAIAIMRDHPLEHMFPLYVRRDVQERDNSRSLKKRGPTPPTKWKCANEDNAKHLKEDERKQILSLIKGRDFLRRKKQYDAADEIRERLLEQYQVHIDDRLNMWWTALEGGRNNQKPPKYIQELKGEGRWNLKKWRQIPTTPENDACVDAKLVNALLTQRDIARREKDFGTADALLEQARTSPDGDDLTLRIHDESRTWRVWTPEPPQFVAKNNAVDPKQECLQLVQEHDPERLPEIQSLLERFPDQEGSILKKLQLRYES